MMKRFVDKAVLVTGAGVGIGYAMCRRFAGEGAKVALNDMDAALADKSARKLNDELGQECVFPFAFDVADVGAVRRAVADCASQFGRLDVVVANAGITNFGSFLEYTPEAFDRLTGVNLRGSYFTAQAGARVMVARQTPGRILLTSSVTGVQAFTNLSAYGITKAGIIMMAKVLASELGRYGITVNAIIPGIVRTERTMTDDPNLDENWQEVVFTRRVSEPDDIAAVASFLASDEAKQMTGQAVVVDGGWVVHSPIPAGHPEKPEFSSRLR